MRYVLNLHRDIGAIRKEMFTCTTNSPEETAHLAELVGQKIREGTVLCLEGDLGVGKTLFVQSLARTLGVEGEVTSPTFNLMNVYEGICPIYHLTSTVLSRRRSLRTLASMNIRKTLKASSSSNGRINSRSVCRRIMSRSISRNRSFRRMDAGLLSQASESAIRNS